MKAWFRTAAALAVILALASVTGAQERRDKKKPPVSKVDSIKIAHAIQKGVEYLRTQIDQATSPQVTSAYARYHEFLLFTLVYAGLPESDADFKRLFEPMIQGPLSYTYSTALQAMILEEIDRVKYQDRIAQCVQFIVDTQCANGQWSYGPGTPTAMGTPSVERQGVATSGKGKADGKKARAQAGLAPVFREKPPIAQWLVIKRMGNGPADGDNSNSQYAALGLRAARDSGVRIPPETMEKAYKWWAEAQHDDGGWSYKGKAGHESYGAMTAAGVGTLSFFLFTHGRDWKRDPAVAKGVAWLAKNFSVTKAPGKCEHEEGQPETVLCPDHYYYLYGIERAGVFYDTEMFGDHDWYTEGAEYILKEQQENGSWLSNPVAGYPVQHTCFAILFLRRASRAFMDVATLPAGR